ncbi:uncharacterized protein MKK02DRAFT_40634 [Dioszegia hungarica]|uniref:Uncharacterized protein n=1 Tax=Dioszegia hungarica TaxID=4972 RepID=A0AA38H212_9TREE|nr:uncharacterized protein MKK02DRAFT_40634 [Dioszegia hungarica]KAI9632330.1 hypothetical protein MKK02DRAFT_40634 [Dioszegia hungarica]
MSANASAPLQAQNGNAQQPAQQPMFLHKKGLLGGQKVPGGITSPTDNVLSPCSAKLSGAKQRHFGKSKPMGLTSQLSKLAVSNSSASVDSKSKIDF